ncbi:Ribonuclease Z 1 [Escovopsis weberi]|uniref:ribonuclease Z n=1 Tax=Escovopsis weberi TaxID=150374 RepID=A0A0M8N185_ESCWE|nr:Ribonuclease Z 1 [Escovopsis weberi]
MTTTVQLASVPSADTPGTCIYLHHDKRSYVFGRVAEGTQRAFGSRKISMGSTEHVFLSGAVGWDQLSGLFGYLLTVGGAAEAAKEGLAAENEKRSQRGGKPLAAPKHAGVGVHGADNLCHVLAACRPVIFRQPISVRTFEHRGDPRADDPRAMMQPDWEDDAIKVWKVPVRKGRFGHPPKRLCDGPDRDGAVDQPPREDEDYVRPRAVASDPGVAAAIVERIMFNGSLKTRSVLVPVTLGQLKPTDVAVVDKDGALTRYNGPYATDGQLIPDADRAAWLFPREGEVGKDQAEDALAINHHPLPATVYSETSMSYIIKCHDRRGKFNAPLAASLGVEAKSFKLLVAGQTVQGKDGPVTPDMVLGERQPGRGIVVADISSVDFLEPFLQRPEWQSAELMDNVAVMYWILGPGLADDARLLRFVQDKAGMKHIFCAPETCPNMITHPGAALIQAQLRRIDPERFPLLTFENTVAYRTPEAGSSSSSLSSSSSPIELGRAGHKLQLMPRLVYDDEAVAPFTDLVEAFESVDAEVLALADEAKRAAAAAAAATNVARADACDQPQLVAEAESQADHEARGGHLPNRDTEIIALGTGSSVPSKYRNVSGTLIRVPGIGNYLLDCGEGTLGQIRRLFGEAGTAEVLRGLRCIVISHVHADHHLGAPSVIRAWYAQSLRDGSHESLLAVSCIERYRGLLEELSQVEDLGFHRLRFPSCSPHRGGRDRDVTTAQMLGTPADHGDDFGLRSIRRVPVPHCWRSYGTQLELASGLRIAYSGDCRPSAAFARECRGAHLLVHECTFGDDKQDHARAKRHSTMAEALWVAREMGAHRTLLTHFSQRYSKADALRRPAGEAGGAASPRPSVLLAFDFMRVRLGEFPEAERFIPAVQRLMEKMAD